MADVEAKMKMKQKADFEGRAFGSLCINDSSLAKAQSTILIEKAGCFCERNTRRILQSSAPLTKFQPEKFKNTKEIEGANSNSFVIALLYIQSRI